MLMDMIVVKRLNYIEKFGEPPKEIWLHSDFIKNLRAELERGGPSISCEGISKKQMPDRIDGMAINENTNRSDIKISFRHPRQKDKVWY